MISYRLLATVCMLTMVTHAASMTITSDDKASMVLEKLYAMCTTYTNESARAFLEGVDQLLTASDLPSGSFEGRIDPLKIQVGERYHLLQVAARAGHATCVEQLCRLAPELMSMQDGMGSTALIFAAAHGHKDCVEILCNRAPESVRVQGYQGFTALHCAAYKGHKECVEFLCTFDPNLRTIPTHDGAIPLHTAINQKHSGVLLPLLGRHAYGYDTQYPNGQSPFMRALSLGDFESIGVLLDARASLPSENINGIFVLQSCVLTCHETVVEMFLRRAYTFFRPIVGAVVTAGLQLRSAERVLMRRGIDNVHLISEIFLATPLRNQSVRMLQGKLILGKQIDPSDMFLALAKCYLADALADEVLHNIEGLSTITYAITPQQRDFAAHLLTKREHVRSIILAGINERYLALLKKRSEEPVHEESDRKVD